jgi:lysophospholipase L1-like esterase
MRNFARVFACFGLLALGLGSGGAQSGRISVRLEKGGIPVFSGSGALFLAGPDSAGDFALFPADLSSGGTAFAPAGEQREESDLGLSVRTAPSGEIGALMARPSGSRYELVFDRFDGSRQIGRTVVRSGDLPLYSPDLDFGPDSKPWGAWIRLQNGREEVVVADLAGGREWTVTGPDLPRASRPKLLVRGESEAWIFWAGRAEGHDRIYSSALRPEGWTSPAAVTEDARYPQTCPAACLDAAGRPLVVWSAYDGNDYEIVSASWTGASWTVPEFLTNNADADLDPAVVFAPGVGPVAVWRRTSPAGHGVESSVRTGAAWSGVARIGARGKDAVRSLSVAVSGDRLALSWISGGEIAIRILAVAEIFEAAGRGPVPASPPDASSPPFDPYRDENQYIAFGDSITFAENHGYEASLESRLASKFGAAQIWNEGVGGETTAEGLIRITDVAAAHAARYLLLMEGTNDVIFLDISMEAAAFDLEEMARRSLQAGILPLIATIIPRKDWRWTVAPYQSRIIELNGRIRKLAAALAIPYVDQYEAFFSYSDADGGWPSLLLDDGVHPNEKGFAFMSDVWYGGIIALPFPPVNVRAARAVDKVLFYRRTGNLLLWHNSSKLDPAGIVGYRIYRKTPTDAAFPAAALAQVPFKPTALEFRFFDSTIDTKRTYQYVITALRADGVEGACSDIARDDII